MEGVEWFHTIDLGDGLVTPGKDETFRKLEWLALPESLESRSVLDVGAWDGFFSFEAERRGAERVLATDSFAWEEPAWGPKGWGTRAGFDLAHRALKSKVEARGIDVLDLDPETIGTFDLVLFLGVLYHLPHPLLGLEKVASVCSNQLILETHVDLLDLGRPAMAFYPGEALAGDDSNWWGPNMKALEAMLRYVGFTRVEVVHREARRYRFARAAYRRMRGPRFRAQQGRCAVHAWK